MDFQFNSAVSERNEAKNMHSMLWFTCLAHTQRIRAKCGMSWVNFPCNVNLWLFSSQRLFRLIFGVTNISLNQRTHEWNDWGSFRCKNFSANVWEILLPNYQSFRLNFNVRFSCRTRTVVQFSLWAEPRIENATKIELQHRSIQSNGKRPHFCQKECNFTFVLQKRSKSHTCTRRRK